MPWLKTEVKTDLMKTNSREDGADDIQPSLDHAHGDQQSDAVDTQTITSTPKHRYLPVAFMKKVEPVMPVVEDEQALHSVQIYIKLRACR